MGKAAVKHKTRDHVKHHSKNLLQSLNRQTVGRTGPSRCCDDAASGNDHRPGQPHVAQGPHGQVGLVPSAEHIAHGAAERNGKAQRCAGGHRVGDQHIAPGHGGHTDKSAASADQARQKANETTGAEQAHRSGQLARGLGLAVQKHLGGGERHK